MIKESKKATNTYNKHGVLGPRIRNFLDPYIFWHDDVIAPRERSTPRNLSLSPAAFLKKSTVFKKDRIGWNFGFVWTIP